MNAAASAAPVSPIPIYEVTPSRPLSLGIRDLWRHHELLYLLAWRDVKVRYKQTLLGIAWSILQPAAIALALTVFLGHLARVPSDGIRYPLFFLPALLLWQLFAAGLNESANSLIASERMVSKVYFPRAVVPASAILSASVDFLIGIVLVVAATFVFRKPPSAAILLAPLFILGAISAAFGIGLWLSALNVRYRDVRYALGFLTQLWLFATPVMYPADVVPAKWRMLYSINPMVGYVEGFRWSMVHGARPSAAILLPSVLSTVLIVVTGLLYFNAVEDSFADTI
jgi:lipopolysaccharide transport system permease protein